MFKKPCYLGDSLIYFLNPNNILHLTFCFESEMCSLRGNALEVGGLCWTMKEEVRRKSLYFNSTLRQANLREEHWQEKVLKVTFFKMISSHTANGKFTCPSVHRPCPWSLYSFLPSSQISNTSLLIFSAEYLASTY